MEQNKANETVDISRDPNRTSVNVKMSKMIDGVNFIFAGVLEILRSLDPMEAKKFVSEFSEYDATAAPSEEHGEGNETLVESNAEKQTSIQNAETAVMENKAVPTITADDITKVIVAKIKQKRSNNEAIGALLKSYGVAKVSELPEAKYEAFITDLSQI